MTRLCDDQRQFGPVTYGRAGWKATRFVWSSGGGDADAARNHLTVYAFGWVARMYLPNILAPFRIKHFAASWDAATVARMGRNFYFETFPREYGFSLSDGFLQLFLGAQTHDSDTTQSWCKHLPWTQWRFDRESIYGLNGELLWQQTERDRRAEREAGGHPFVGFFAAKRAAQRTVFVMTDYDGERIEATTLIEQREYLFGEGWFKWLSIFRPRRIRRSLDIEFSAQVGPEKGSWKGGTLGHGIEMLPGELHEAAFRRYCEQEHTSKYRRFQITFVGRAPAAALL